MHGALLLSMRPRRASGLVSFLELSRSCFRGVIKPSLLLGTRCTRLIRLGFFSISMAEDSDETSERQPEWMKFERKRGIITEKDREFLIHPGDYSKEAARNKRYRIRERIKNSLYDFSLLTELKDNDVKRTFESMDDKGYVLRAATEFLYRGLCLISDKTDSTEGELLEETLKRSIESAEHERGNIATTNIKINIDREEADSDELMQRLIGGRGTNNEFAYLMKSESIGSTFEELAKADKPIVIQDEDEEEIVMESETIQEMASAFNQTEDQEDSE